MKRLEYPIIISPLSEEDGGGFLATVPDLPGCMSDGETPEEAAVNVQDAIVAWLEGAEELGRPIPAPSKVTQVA
jgi:antitoxin HicB